MDTNRLNWIDWAKAIAITFVVFGHVPEERGSFFLNYIVTFHMPLFFFISGYLTKKELYNKSTIKKYTYTLIIPYFIYNILSYPFWAFRYTIEHPNEGLVEYIKPILGTIFIQQNSLCSRPLNGVTWFLIALLMMKIILSICNKYKYGLYFYFVLSITCAVFYVYNEFYRFTTDLVPVGFAKCVPFYLLGYLSKEWKLLPTICRKYDWITCVICITSSLAFYQLRREDFCLTTYGWQFWAICILAIWGFFCLCRILDSIHSIFILNISIGTMVIMGLHGTVITSINFIFSKLLNITGITYPCYFAVFIALFIVSVFYPVIILFKKKFPIMLGKTKI
jgi:fucose 4-O-acetylase-like acetyltransferase